MNPELLKDTKTRYFFVELLFVLAFGILILFVLAKVFHIHMTDGDLQIAALLITVAQFLLVMEFLKKNNIKVAEIIGKPSKKKFIFEIPVTLVVTYIGSIGLILILLALVQLVNPSILEGLESSLTSSSINMTSTFVVVISIFSAAIVAPIVEEFIFRGILMNRLYNKYGLLKSVIYSSLIFFIMHINPNPMLLCLGVSCAFLVYKYKSLIPSMVLHACNNFIVSLRDVYDSTENSSSSSFNADYSFFTLGSILFGMYVLYLYISFRKCKVDKLL
mgnify:FL=1